MMHETHEEPIQTDFVMRQQDVETKTGRVSISAVVCETLEQAGFLNAFSTRLGGVCSLASADLSLSFFKGDLKENTDENRRRFLKAISAENVPIVSAKQTHSTERCTVE